MTCPFCVLRGLVVLLAEVHDVDAVLAEGRAHGRRRGGLTGPDLQLDVREHLLRFGAMWISPPAVQAAVRPPALSVVGL